MRRVTVVGGGLAGCETALQLSARGIEVELIEMRPGRNTPAHRSANLAELVCSNSLKSENLQTASGLLKAELELLGCFLLKMAEGARVPAGHALAVDRELFGSIVSSAIDEDPRIRLARREQTDLDLPGCGVIATGPLTSEALSASIREHFGDETLYFYDAISISLATESIETGRMFKASRYGKGNADYWNIPLTRQQYAGLLEFLKSTPKAEKHGFEDGMCFDACLPVDVLAGRGDDTLRFGPLKPRGLDDPLTGREPYAVIQLRQENASGSMTGMVGFQTRMTYGSQKDMLKLIPGLENAEIVRFGSIHRNTFIDSPRLLDEGQMSRRRKGLFFAGQITGVEGYVESIAHGLMMARNIVDFMEDRAYRILPPETIIGGLQRHLSGGASPFQPMNANFGILPPIGGERALRKNRKAERSLEALKIFLDRRD